MGTAINSRKPRKLGRRKTATIGQGLRCKLFIAMSNLIKKAVLKTTDSLLN